MEYIVIVEPSGTGFGAYVPDLPGCVAVGETRSETLALIREAIAFHIEGLREHGDDVPQPHATVERIAV
jgi:predicted RNase H-like HicB family nuclease